MAMRSGAVSRLPDCLLLIAMSTVDGFLEELEKASYIHYFIFCEHIISEYFILCDLIVGASAPDVHRKY